jgi:hypothetical protein
MTGGSYDHLIRWYPAQWRERYGDEMTALLEDTYAAAAEVPLRQRVSLAWSGVAERARSAGLVGWSGDAAARQRGGALLVLCGWAFYLVAGAMFVKISDRWSMGSAHADHWVATSGFNVVAVAAGVGCLIVALAALLVLPSFVRYLRAGGWPEIRRAVVVAAVAVVVSGGLFALLVVRAHGMSTQARNGGNALYSALFVIVGLVFICAIGSGTAAAVTVSRRVELSRPTMRALSGLAIALVGVMGLTLVSFVSWWATEAAHSPGFLAQTIGNGAPFSSSVVPPTLLAAGFCMTMGLALGIAGLVRIVGSLDAGGRAVA